MPKEKPGPDRPLNWMTKALLFLIYLPFAYAFIHIIVTASDGDFTASQVVVLGLLIFGMIVLLVSERLVELRFSRDGVIASMAPLKADVLANIPYLTEDPDIAETVSKEVVQAQNVREVKSAVEKARGLNITKNLKIAEQAIQEKKKVFIRYRPVDDSEIKNYLEIPVDLKPGDTVKSAPYDYFVTYSEEDGHPKTFRVDRIISLAISDQSFDRASFHGQDEILANPHIARDW